MARIIIHDETHGSPQPIRLTINGKSREYPCNKELSVDADELEALANSDLKLTVLEAPAAAESGEAAAEQAPAPEGSADGDAGAGGGAGDPASETSEPAADAAGEGEEK